MARLLNHASPSGEASIISELKNLKPPEHLCFFYHSHQEWQDFAASFIKIGLERQEKCWYVYDTHSARQVRDVLKSAGIDVALAETSGKLILSHGSKVYLKSGCFDPESMVASLLAEMEKALTEGYPGLRITGETDWVVNRQPGAERILEYEIKVNRDIFPKYPCLAVCQYEMYRFKPETIKGLVLAHPKIMLGNKVHSNFYYIPSGEFLNIKRAEAEVELWLNNIERTNKKDKEIQAQIQRFQMLFKESIVITLVIDEKGVCIEANRAALEFLGCSRDQLLGKSIWNIPGSLTGQQSEIFPLQSPRNIEMQYLIDKTVKTLLLYILPVKVDNTMVLYAFGQDITIRKEIEQSLKESEERFRKLYLSMNEGLALDQIIYDDSGKAKDYIILDVNPAYESITGITKEKAVGRKASELYGTGVLPNLDIYASVAATGQPTSFETYFPPMKKHFSISVFSPEKGKFATVFSDITRKKRAEEKLKQSEERYRLMTENAADLIYRYRLKPEPEFEYVSPSATRITGYSPEEYYADPSLIIKIVHPDDRLVLQSIYHPSNEFVSGSTLRWIRKDGKIIYTEQHNRPIYNAARELIAVEGIARDITDHKEFEKQLQESEYKFNQLFANMSNCAMVYKAIDNGKDFIVTDFNKAAEKTEQISRNDIIGRRVTEVLPGIMQFGLLEVFQRVWKTGDPEKYPVKQYRDNRILGWRENSIYKLPGGEIVAIYEDVTEKRLLEERNAQLAAIVESSDDAIMGSDLDGIITSWNAGARSIYGYDESEVIGKSLSIIIPTNRKDECSSILARVKKGEKIHHFETIRLRKDGTEIQVSISISPLRDKKNQIIGVSTIARDITERKRAKTALKESELFSSSLLTNSPNPIIVINPDRTIRYVNPALERLTGFSNAELLGKRAPHPWWQENSAGALPHGLSDDEVDVSEFACRRKDGTPFWVSVKFKPVKENGKVKFYLGNWVDITERKKFIEELKASEAFSNCLLTNAPNPIILLDFETSIRYVNPPLEKLTGYSSAELIGKKFPYPYWPESTAKDIQSSLEKILRLDAHFTAERCFRKKNGDAIWVETHSSLVQLAGEKEPLHMAIWIDITERKKIEDALRESELQFSTIAYYTYDWEYWIDPDGNIKYISPSCERVTGYRPEEFIKCPSLLEEIVHPDDRKFIRDHLDHIAKTENCKFDFRIITRTGEIRWIEHNCQTVFDKDGVLLGRRASNVDITERKIAEQELKASENFNSSLLNNSPNPIIVVNIDTSIRYVNLALERLTGFSNVELIGKKPPYPWWQENSPGAFPQGLSDDEVDVLEFVCRRKDGTPFWISVKFRPVKENGIVKFYLGNWVDITDRKQAEEKLKLYADRAVESSEEWQRTFDAIKDVVCLISSDFKFIKLNKAGFDSLGKPPEEVIGKTCYELVHGLHKPIEGCPCVETLKTSKSGQGEVCDHERYFMASASPIFNEKGEVIAFSHIIADITGRKQAEKELEQLYEKEKAQREELQEEAKARGMFIDVLAHELRTPLTPIMVSAGILQDVIGPQPDSIQARLFSNITSGAQILAHRLEELLDIARYSRGTFKLQPLLTNVPNFIHEVVSRFKPALDAHNQDIVLELAEDLPAEAVIDSSRLEQVITNLLSNASKFSPQKGKIIIRAKAEEKGLLIEVQDQGIGISAEEQKRLFQPYHRVEQDRHKFPGLGLGLAVSKQIIEVHGGKISVSSQPGQGSTFSFWIPLIP